MKPDYGLYLWESGARTDARYTFYDFRLFNISLLEDGQYTTLVVFPVEGQRYALSLDFTRAQLDQLLARVSPEVQSAVRKNLEHSRVGDCIDLDEAIAFGVTAHLGELQVNGNERYVPFVAQDFF